MDSTFSISAVKIGSFQSHPTTKTGYFQSHPQSIKENALRFTCLARASLQGSVGTQEYS